MTKLQLTRPGKWVPQGKAGEQALLDVVDRWENLAQEVIWI